MNRTVERQLMKALSDAAVALAEHYGDDWKVVRRSCREGVGYPQLAIELWGPDREEGSERPL